ncbi:MAG TPA: hypothetical protein VF169_10245 [Albitalea sp.]|uniref:hypothetical protein n=1 Tax=Piscinibacter sp. TaxID=1903157 RepID=UPI002ED6AB00
MNKVPNIPWWQAMGLPDSEPVADTDYADMGTAFGLDASLSRGEPAAGEGAAEAAPWRDRLNGRSVI